MKIHLRHPFAAAAVLLLLLFFDGSGIFFGCFLAMLLHESSHTAVYSFLVKRPCEIEIGVGGIALLWREQDLRPSGRTLTLLAGPAANFITALICFACCKSRFRLFASVFGSVNLLLGAFNLLPLHFLDGGRLTTLLLHRFAPVDLENKILFTLQLLCLGLLTAAFLLYITDLRSRIALLLFLSYFCCKSFCLKN